MSAHTPTRAELLDLFREEEAALKAMTPRIEPDRSLHELEKLNAADLVMRARNVDQVALRLNELERTRLAQAQRRVAAELLEAARKLERYRPDDEIPEFLRA